MYIGIIEFGELRAGSALVTQCFFRNIIFQGGGKPIF